MIIAIVLIVAAAVGLISILILTAFSGLQISEGNPQQIQAIDVEAFRNLVDPAENEYLRRRLGPSEFRRVQRKRLQATMAYIQVAKRNAALLALIGQEALASGDPTTIDAAQQLVDSAMLLRSNASVALFRIYVALAWP